MEHGDPGRDRIPPRHGQEPSTKLPPAGLVSTPSDTGRNATVGISTFSPLQTLDHFGREEKPTQDLDLTTGKIFGTLRSTTPPPPQDPPAEFSTPFNSAASIAYRECLKNHAASTGNHAVDGCREFMPGGEEGTQESFKCAACDCHRNFHRKEITGEPVSLHFLALNSRQNPTIEAPFQLHFATTVSPIPPAIVNLEGNGDGGEAESSSEYLDMFQFISGGYALNQPSSSGPKKRFRTKFTQEQKDRMYEFATKLEWSLHNEDEQEMRKFCREVGVKRQVFKVWMHNNKKKQT